MPEIFSNRTWFVGQLSTMLHFTFSCHVGLFHFWGVDPMQTQSNTRHVRTLSTPTEPDMRITQAPVSCCAQLQATEKNLNVWQPENPKGWGDPEMERWVGVFVSMPYSVNRRSKIGGGLTDFLFVGSLVSISHQSIEISIKTCAFLNGYLFVRRVSYDVGG